MTILTKIVAAAALTGVVFMNGAGPLKAANTTVLQNCAARVVRVRGRSMGSVISARR